MWYFLDCLPGASIYAGLKRGVTREAFEEAMRRGQVEQTLHQPAVESGQSIFIPSGRVHAIGAGCLIVEVQQNSDTTYRVFDWNRSGLDGKPRALHIEESMRSIDFEDFEPSISNAPSDDRGIVSACEHFAVERWILEKSRAAISGGRFAIFAVVSGRVGFGDRTFDPGSFFLVPSGAGQQEIRPLSGAASVLYITLPLLSLRSLD
jgi:mannose-6-phosphate isomerase